MLISRECGIALETTLVLVIDYTHWGTVIFGTAPIAPEVWLFMLSFALGMLLLKELRKAVAVKLEKYFGDVHEIKSPMKHWLACGRDGLPLNR